MPEHGLRTPNAIFPRLDAPLMPLLATTWKVTHPYGRKYRETAISWAANKDGENQLKDIWPSIRWCGRQFSFWKYFRSVIDWIQAIFPKKRREMKGTILPWAVVQCAWRERTDLDAKNLSLGSSTPYGWWRCYKKIRNIWIFADQWWAQTFYPRFDRRDAQAAFLNDRAINALFAAMNLLWANAGWPYNLPGVKGGKNNSGKPPDALSWL